MENHKNSSNCKILLGVFIGVFITFLVTAFCFSFIGIHFLQCSFLTGGCCGAVPDFKWIYLVKPILFGVLFLSIVICFTVIMVKYMKFEKESERRDAENNFLEKVLKPSEPSQK